jgi:hypothetical protein
MSDDIGPDGARKRGPDAAADDLDAEGHRARRAPEGAVDEPGPEEARRRMVAEDDEDDTEGHRRK